MWRLKFTYLKNHIYTKLPLSESSKDKLHLTATEGMGFGFVYEGTSREGREEGTRDKLTRTNLVRSSETCQQTAVIFEPENKNNHFYICT